MAMARRSDAPVRAILGPTNTGKTYLAIERMCGHSSGVIGFPLRLLAREVYDRVVAIKGEKQVKQDNAGEVLYQGIAARAFERQFQLADYVVVKGANLENGLLHVDLVREIPEAKKPRQIAINGSGNPQVVDTKAAA